MRAPLPTILALAALVLGPGPARAQDPAAPAPPVGEVRAGAEIVTIVPRLPAGATEFELVLLPESGPAIQVSPELPVGSIDVCWRMPHTFGRTARLAVRWGAPGCESQTPPSAAFALASPGADDVADLIALKSDAARWPECEAASLPGFASGADPATLGQPLTFIRAIAPHASAMPTRPARAPGTLGFQNDDDAASPSCAPRSRAPAFRPLRN